MTMTLRLGTPDAPRGVGHLAEFCGSHARWRALCNRISTSVPLDGGADRQWIEEHGSWRHSPRLALLEWDLPPGVPVCRRCIQRRLWEHERLLEWLAERGQPLP